MNRVLWDCIDELETVIKEMEYYTGYLRKRGRYLDTAGRTEECYQLSLVAKHLRSIAAELR